MIWNPSKMLLYDVYKPFGSLDKVGLKKIGRHQNNLILTFKDGLIKIVRPGEIIPLPYDQ